MMEAVYGVSADDGLPMWVADMDFRAPDCVVDRLRAATEHGIFAYANNTEEYNGAIQWWMRERHGWEVQPDWIFTTTGLVNGVGMCLDTFNDIPICTGSLGTGLYIYTAGSIKVWIIMAF